MCLAVPLEIKRLLPAPRAVAAQGETELEIDLSLVPDAQPGDWVIVHAGFAIQILSTEDARETLDLLDEVMRPEEPG